MRIEVPVPQSAIAGPDGRVAKEWRAFFVSLANTLRNDTGTIDGGDILASAPTAESAVSDLDQRVSQLEEALVPPESQAQAIADLQALVQPPAPESGSNVIGPVSSTDNAVARFDGTTGKRLQNSVIIADDSGNVIGVGTLTAGGNINTSGVYQKGGVQVVGAQGAAVTDPTGGAVIDVEGRAQLSAWLARARAHGLIA